MLFQAQRAAPADGPAARRCIICSARPATAGCGCSSAGASAATSNGTSKPMMRSSVPAPRRAAAERTTSRSLNSSRTACESNFKSVFYSTVRSSASAALQQQRQQRCMHCMASLSCSCAASIPGSQKAAHWLLCCVAAHLHLSIRQTASLPSLQLIARAGCSWRDANAQAGCRPRQARFWRSFPRGLLCQACCQTGAHTLQAH